MCGVTLRTNEQRSDCPIGATMTIEERKMSRPDSRWKAELLNLYRTSESQWRESLDAGDRDYQSGIMMACAAIWHRVTGEALVK